MNGQADSPATDPGAALADLGEALRPALVRLGAAVTGDLEVGHDLAQEALLALLRSPAPVRSPEAWLRQVVVNQGRTWARRQGRHRAYLRRWEAWRTEAGRSHGQVDLADQLAVRGALQELSPDHRAVLVLRFYDDLTVPEIAATLAVSEGTVKSRIHRGLARLKEAIGDE